MPLVAAAMILKFSLFAGYLQRSLQQQQHLKILKPFKHDLKNTAGMCLLALFFWSGTFGDHTTPLYDPQLLYLINVYKVGVTVLGELIHESKVCECARARV